MEGIVLYGAIVHGNSSILAEYNAESSGVVKELSKVILEQVTLIDDKKVCILS